MDFTPKVTFQQQQLEHPYLTGNELVKIRLKQCGAIRA